MWHIRARVMTKGITKNAFKFIFFHNEDKELIYAKRPWSLSGAHLVLKEWPQDDAIEEVSFNTFTFTFWYMNYILN